MNEQRTGGLKRRTQQTIVVPPFLFPGLKAETLLVSCPNKFAFCPDKKKIWQRIVGDETILENAIDLEIAPAKRKAHSVVRSGKECCSRRYFLKGRGRGRSRRCHKAKDCT